MLSKDHIDQNLPISTLVSDCRWGTYHTLAPMNDVYKLPEEGLFLHIPDSIIPPSVAIYQVCFYHFLLEQAIIFPLVYILYLH